MKEQVMNSSRQIHERASYHRWKATARFLSTSPTMEEIMCHIHGLLDTMNAYGSPEQTDLARESLVLLTQEDQKLQARYERGRYRTLDKEGNVDFSNLSIFDLTEEAILKAAKEEGYKITEKKMDELARMVSKGLVLNPDWREVIDIRIDKMFDP